MNIRGLACIVVLATSVVLWYRAQTEEPEKTVEVTLVADSPETIPNVPKPIVDDISNEVKVAILGHVFDAASGLPITTFEVARGTKRKYGHTTMWDPETPYPYEGMSHPEGIFRIENFDASKTVVVVRAAGYAPLLQNVTVLPGKQTEIEVLLEPGLIVRGRVFDPDGNLIERAQIYIGDPPSDFSWRHGDVYSAAALSDADGRYFLESLPTSTTRISAFSPGFPVASVDFTGVPGTVTEVDIHLSAGGFVDGVVSIAGKGIEGQRVSLKNRKLHLGSIGTRTDRRGYYRFTGIPVGTWDLSTKFAPPGALVPPPRNSLHVYEFHRTLSIELDSVLTENFAHGVSNASVEGHVLGLEDVPASITVDVSWTDAEGKRMTVSDEVDAEDYYRIDYLSGGVAQIVTRVRGAGEWPRGRREEIDLIEGRVIRHDLDFTKRALIHGQLATQTPADVLSVRAIPGRHALSDAASNLNLLLRTSNGLGLSDSVREPGGAYAIHITYPGVYTVTALSAVYETTRPTIYAVSVVTVEDGDEVEVNFELD